MASSHAPTPANAPRCPRRCSQVQRQTAVKPMARTRCVTKALSDVNVVVGGERRRPPAPCLLERCRWLRQLAALHSA